MNADGRCAAIRRSLHAREGPPPGGEPSLTALMGAVGPGIREPLNCHYERRGPNRTSTDLRRQWRARCASFPFVGARRAGSRERAVPAPRPHQNPPQGQWGGAELSPLTVRSAYGRAAAICVHLRLQFCRCRCSSAFWAARPVNACGERTRRGGVRAGRRPVCAGCAAAGPRPMVAP